MRKLKDPYKHDCRKCVWVGWFIHTDPWANIYLCGKTIVIRFSDEGSDYWSGTAGDCERGPIGHD